MKCSFKRLIIKYYFLHLFLLIFIGFGCLYVVIRYKKLPKFDDPVKYLSIYGMRSNDKLKTFELIKQQTGTNKFFSFSGLEANDDVRNYANTINIDKDLCSDLDTNNNQWSKFVVELNNEHKEGSSLSFFDFQVLAYLKEYKVQLENYLRATMGNQSNVRICSLSESMSEYFDSTAANMIEKTVKQFIQKMCLVRDKTCSPYIDPLRPTVTNIYVKLDDHLGDTSPLCSPSNLPKTPPQLRLSSVDLSRSSWRHAGCYSHIYTSHSWRILLASFLVLVLLKFVYLNTIFIISIMSLFGIALALLVAHVANTFILGSTCLFPLFNIVAVVAALAVNLFDSFVWSVCYTESRKKSTTTQPQQQQQQQHHQQRQQHPNGGGRRNNSADERSIKIVTTTFGQIYYYLWPKNVAFILILVVAYLNKIQLVQLVSVFSIIVFVSYFFISAVSYLFIIAFLSKHHHKFSFSHRIKVFETDVNKEIENLFSIVLPYLIKKFSLFWVLLFTCTTVISFMTLFYMPKLKLADDVLTFNVSSSSSSSSSMDSSQGSRVYTTTTPPSDMNRSIVAYIVWGSQIQETSSTGLEPLFANRLVEKRPLDQLLDRVMETNGFENFNLMYKVCQNIGGGGGDDAGLFTRVYCFGGDYFERNLHMLISSSAKSSSASSLKIYQTYCDPIMNAPSYERFIQNRKLALTNNRFKQDDKTLFTDCIKWWSLNLRDSNDVFYGPLFLVNRVLPNIYLIRLETSLIASQDFESMQNNFNILENWWKSLQQRYKLNERFTWWTSPDFENYLMQKKTSRQMLLGVLLPLIIILAFTTYACSNLFVSFTVFLAHVQAVAHILAALVWLLEWRIDLLNALAYVLVVLVTVTQYTIVSGVAHRFSPHVDLKMTIQWCSETFGSLMLAYCSISLAASLPFFFSSFDLLRRLGTVVVVSNLVGYFAAAVYLPALMLAISRVLFRKFSAAQTIGIHRLPAERNMHHRHYMNRHFSSSSFSPSNFYSHAATGSTYFESELTTMSDYRRRTLSRCNSSLLNNGQQQSSRKLLTHQSSSVETNGCGGTGVANSTGTPNLLQIPNPNYLQIPRTSRVSLRRRSSSSSAATAMRRRFSKSVRMSSVESSDGTVTTTTPTSVASPLQPPMSDSLLVVVPPASNNFLTVTMHENLIESCINENEVTPPPTTTR